MACFDVWADMYAGTDLVFKQVILGPVRTAMHHGESFPAGRSGSGSCFRRRSTTPPALSHASRRPGGRG